MYGLLSAFRIPIALREVEIRVFEQPRSNVLHDGAPERFRSRGLEEGERFLRVVERSSRRDAVVRTYRCESLPLLNRRVVLEHLRGPRGGGEDLPAPGGAGLAIVLVQPNLEAGPALLELAGPGHEDLIGDQFPGAQIERVALFACDDPNGLLVSTPFCLGWVDYPGEGPGAIGLRRPEEPPTVP